MNTVKFKNLGRMTLLLGLICFALPRNAAYADQSPAKNFSFFSSLDKIELKGTLELPMGQSRGAVLMLVGSGKADRDETVPAKLTYSGKTEKLFAQLSPALTKAGYATFRYDKRGVLNSEGKVDMSIWKSADRDHLLADAVDAAQFLSKHTGVPVNDLVILGHSEGTIVAVETALKLGGKVKALLLFGAQARSMKEMLHYQIVESRSRRSSGVGSDEDPETEYKKAIEMIATTKDEFAPDGKPINWYRQYLAAPANETRLPLVQAKKIIFQGEIDPQTPIDEVERFKKAGATQLQVFRYPQLGHGFSPDKDGKPTIGPIQDQVLADLTKVARAL